MNVRVRAKAEDDIDLIFAWVAQHNPIAAARIVARLRLRIRTLGIDGFAHIGHEGKVPGTLETLVRPYVIVYKILPPKELTVIAIFHAARER